MKGKTALWMVHTQLLIISMLTLAFYVQTIGAVPTTWIVDDDAPADFSSIQEAINSPLVANGDTIFVRTGTYYENVVVSKSVSLVGQNPANTIVDGGGIGSVMTVMVNNVVIENFTIRNGQYGIEIASVYNCIVKNNNVTANINHGIWLSSSSNNMVSANNVANNDIGINILVSSFNSITGNNITNNTHSGIEIWYSNNNSVSVNNIAANLVWGVYISVCWNNSFSGNNIAANLVWGVDIVDESPDNRFYHNNFIDNTQQVLIFSPGKYSFWENGYPSGGNYWSDHIGTDDFTGPYQNVTGSDGIVDTPYHIDSYNHDHYPLINPWTPLVGDVDGDGDVDRYDCGTFAMAYGTSVGQPKYHVRCDFVGDPSDPNPNIPDGYINRYDAGVLAQNYGKTI